MPRKRAPAAPLPQEMHRGRPAGAQRKDSTRGGLNRQARPPSGGAGSQLARCIRGSPRGRRGKNIAGGRPPRRDERFPILANAVEGCGARGSPERAGGATVKWRTVVPLVLLVLVAGLAGAAPPNASGWAAGIDAAAGPDAQGPASCPEASNPNEPLTVSVGEQFTIAVAANRTTGYSWQLAHPPDSSVVQPAGSSYVPPGVARPGAEGKECWTFNAVGPG